MVFIQRKIASGKRRRKACDKAKFLSLPEIWLKSFFLRIVRHFSSIDNCSNQLILARLCELLFGFIRLLVYVASCLKI